MSQGHVSHLLGQTSTHLIFHQFVAKDSKGEKREGAGRGLETPSPKRGRLLAGWAVLWDLRNKEIKRKIAQNLTGYDYYSKGKDSGAGVDRESTQGPTVCQWIQLSWW